MTASLFDQKITNNSSNFKGSLVGFSFRFPKTKNLNKVDKNDFEQFLTFIFNLAGADYSDFSFISLKPFNSPGGVAYTCLTNFDRTICISGPGLTSLDNNGSVLSSANTYLSLANVTATDHKSNILNFQSLGKTQSETRDPNEYLIEICSAELVNKFCETLTEGKTSSKNIYQLLKDNRIEMNKITYILDLEGNILDISSLSKMLQQQAYNQNSLNNERLNPDSKKQITEDSISMAFKKETKERPATLIVGGSSSSETLYVYGFSSGRNSNLTTRFIYVAHRYRAELLFSQCVKPNNISNLAFVAAGFLHELLERCYKSNLFESALSYLDSFRVNSYSSKNLVRNELVNTKLNWLNRTFAGVKRTLDENSGSNSDSVQISVSFAAFIKNSSKHVVQVILNDPILLNELASEIASQANNLSRETQKLQSEAKKAAQDAKKQAEYQENIKKNEAVENARLALQEAKNRQSEKSQGWWIGHFNFFELKQLPTFQEVFLRIRNYVFDASSLVDDYNRLRAFSFLVDTFSSEENYPAAFKDALSKDPDIRRGWYFFTHDTKFKKMFKDLIDKALIEMLLENANNNGYAKFQMANKSPFEAAQYKRNSLPAVKGVLTVLNILAKYAFSVEGRNELIIQILKNNVFDLPSEKRLEIVTLDVLYLFELPDSFSEFEEFMKTDPRSEQWFSDLTDEVPVVTDVGEISDS